MITLPSKLLTGLSKVLWNSGEFPASLNSRLAFPKINGVKLQQNNFLSSKAPVNLMHLITTIYKQVLCIHILYMLNVQTNWQASKSSICFSTSRYTSFQKSKKDRMEFRHLKRNWVKSHQWNKNEKSNS